MSGYIPEAYEKYIDLVNKKLPEYLRSENLRQEKVIKAMEYSLSAGGKRIRPILAMEFCRLAGGEPEQALPAACAIEMTHTFSLIHDDLPCMDNDDMRRGRPSCHKAFDEATALLAGDGLEVLPYEILSYYGIKTGKNIQALMMIMKLSHCTGVYGMTGGQQIDTQHWSAPHTEEQLLDMYRLKTGCLLQAACYCGCIAGGGDEKKAEQAEVYGENLGLAFQLVDDILDVTGDENILGKPIGSDAAQGKQTYVALRGIEKAKEKADEFTEKALKALESFKDIEMLKEFTLQLLHRNK